MLAATASELPLNFSQQGPTGAAGPVGVAGGQGVAGAQGTGDECRTPVGHMTLTGSPSLSSDVCAVSRVRVGAQSAGGQSQAGTEYELTRLLDGLSPKLFKAAVQGTPFKSAKIQVYKPCLVTPTETLTLVAVPKKGV